MPSWTATTAGVFAFCNGAVQAVLVLYATGPLHMGRVGFGLLMAGASLGGLLASLVAGRVAGRNHRNAHLADGLLASGSYLLLAFIRTPVVAGFAVSIEAAGLLLGNVASSACANVLFLASCAAGCSRASGWLSPAVR